jgi:hypothetical protein
LAAVLEMTLVVEPWAAVSFAHGFLPLQPELPLLMLAPHNPALCILDSQTGQGNQPVAADFLRP